MSKIKELPKIERPREKAWLYGVSALADYELLALIIGHGTSNRSVLDIAFDLLASSNGLLSLVNTDYHDFMKIKGIGKTKAILLNAIFEIVKRVNQAKIKEEQTNQIVDAPYLYKRYKDELTKEDQEKLILVGLDARRKMIFEKVVFLGSETDMPASTMPILSLLVRHNARKFYIIHNHPRYSCQHSDSDKLFADQLDFEANKLSLRLLESIVISPDGYSIYRPLTF